MTGDIIERMRTALRKSITQFEDLEGRFPADEGCIECTVGTVPNDKNTGLCGYHLARAVLAEAEELGPADIMYHYDNFGTLYLSYREKQNVGQVDFIVIYLDQPKEPTT
jgi:hypothetical protein